MKQLITGFSLAAISAVVTTTAFAEGGQGSAEGAEPEAGVVGCHSISGLAALRAKRVSKSAGDLLISFIRACGH